MGFHISTRLNGASAAGQSDPDSYFLNRRVRGFAANDSSNVTPTQAQPGEAHRTHFAVFRAERVTVTSTLFDGGDWRWSLSDQEGVILVEAGGYRSEEHCRAAVAALQAGAARATVA